jgi:molecular chaperone DnaJ
MPGDYYIVLGIERGANPSQIKRAYREAIKRHHPDMAGGSDNTRAFREAREAYEVLSDTDKRRAYDAELTRRKSSVRTANPEAVIAARSARWHELRDRPSILDLFFDGFVPGFYSRLSSRSGKQDLYLEVILTPAEARQGGVFPVSVPVRTSCPDCRASGWRDGFYCPTCQGCGAVQSTREFSLTIPPGTRHGTAVEVAMDGIGLAGVMLIVDVVIRQDARDRRDVPW